MDQGTLGDDTLLSNGRRGATKLRAPSVRDDRLPRPTVTARLSSRPTPLVLVSAPAGFGKTTAVVNWLQSERRRFVDQPGRRPPLTVMALFSQTMRNLKREKVYQVTTPWLVDHNQYQQAFGVDVTPHPEAVKQTVAWFKAHPPSDLDNPSVEVA